MNRNEFLTAVTIDISIRLHGPDFIRWLAVRIVEQDCGDGCMGEHLGKSMETRRSALTT